jgi:hypothetical protein
LHDLKIRIFFEPGVTPGASSLKDDQVARQIHTNRKSGSTADDVDLPRQEALLDCSTIWYAEAPVVKGNPSNGCGYTLVS